MPGLNHHVTDNWYVKYTHIKYIISVISSNGSTNLLSVKIEKKGIN